MIQRVPGQDGLGALLDAGGLAVHCLPQKLQGSVPAIRHLLLHQLHQHPEHHPNLLLPAALLADDSAAQHCWAG